MATIFSDDFNRADADSLGGDWTERGADFDIVSNGVNIPNGGNGGGGYLGVVGRRVNYSTDDSDGYFASIRPSSGRVRLFSRVSGVATSIATTDAETINFDTFYTVKVDMNGTTIKELIDGSEILSATNSALSAAGDGGLMLSSGDDDQFWDDFLSEDGGGAATRRVSLGGVFIDATRVVLAG